MSDIQTQCRVKRAGTTPDTNVPVGRPESLRIRGNERVRVLIVDDSKAMRMIVGRELRSAGFADLHIAEAANGVDAMAVVKDFNPELVLSDWNMPGMTGLDLLKSLRGDGHIVPFGFITTEASAEMRDAAADAGAFSFVTKPFTADDLRDALAQFA